MHSNVEMQNNDDLYLARAVIIACVQKHSHEPGSNYESVRKGDQNRKTSTQKRLALNLMRRAGLAHHVGPCSTAELIQMQAAIKNAYQIKVYLHYHHGFIFTGTFNFNVF